MPDRSCAATTFLAAVALFSLISVEAPAQESQRARMTVTGSSTVVRYSGWEKDLVGKDPSLRHWTWMPIDSYRYRTKAVPLPERSKSVYTKPAHVDTVVARRHSNPYVHIETLTDRGVQAARLPRGKTNPYVHIETYAGLSHADVQAQLGRESVSGQVAPPASAASYADAYGSIRPRSSAPGPLLNERREVHGRLRGVK